MAEEQDKGRRGFFLRDAAGAPEAGRERRRFALPDDEKQRRLEAIRERLSGSMPPHTRRAGGWLGAALLWVALIGLGSLGLGYWFARYQGDTGFAVLANGSLELRLGPGGHYEVAGQVGAEPVRFIIDTGASLTSIPLLLGKRLGIRSCSPIGFDVAPANVPGCCRPAIFHTANGTVEACVARVPSLRFGDFEVRNVQVALMPGVGERALLGMNVLKHFSIVQEGRRLRLTAVGGPP